ncbi:glycoside hydrolase family 18 protein [Xylariaceae sp. FL0662B]|nr:glycoside hydrolase family 18 protein [Xylariaceae sp. FL0662B]
MAPYYSTLAAGLLWASAAFAGFNPSSSNNLAIYWGQNSAGVTNSGASQKPLAEYCSDTTLNVIPIAFLANIDPPKVDLSNIGDINIGNDITACQKAGKTVLLSIGGATLSGGISDASRAQAVADEVWGMFGPKGDNSSNRPFGDAVIDGFDIDVESPLPNIGPFVARLRENMDKASSGGRKFYLSSAPQCPFPDQNNKDMLSGSAAVSFDFLMVQFYNNPQCDVRAFNGGGSTSSGGFNMDTWDKWAHTESKNPDVKVLLGVPGSPTAVGSPSQKASYKTAEELAPIISYSKQFSSFGGVMVWDMSQVFDNNGFLSGLSSALNGKKRSEGTEARSHARDWNVY